MGRSPSLDGLIVRSAPVNRAIIASSSDAHAKEIAAAAAFKAGAEGVGFLHFMAAAPPLRQSFRALGSLRRWGHAGQKKTTWSMDGHTRFAQYTELSWKACGLFAAVLGGTCTGEIAFPGR